MAKHFLTLTAITSTATRVAAKDRERVRQKWMNAWLEDCRFVPWFTSDRILV